MPVCGLEGHIEASSLGRIRSVARTVRSRKGYRKIKPKELKQFLNGGRHPTVHVVDMNGKYRTFTVSSLVLLAFAGPRPDGHIAEHLDRNPENNRPGNLIWISKEDSLLASERRATDPSEQEIALEAERIRSGWSEQEERNRQMHKPARWKAPTVNLSSLPDKIVQQTDSINREHCR